MQSADRRRMTSLDWDIYKSRIQQLLIHEGKTLSDTIQQLTREPDFPHANISKWKKQIARWGLDIKHHKYSTIVAAAAHYQQCQDEGRPFYFALPNCKPVTEEELLRYTGRRGLVIVGGKLVPQAAATARTTNALQGDTDSPFNGSNTTSTHTASSELAINRSSGPMARRSTLTSKQQIRRLRRLQRQRLLRMWAAYSSGVKFISPSDLNAPDATRNYEKLLWALDSCLTKSFNIGDWGLTQDGRYLYDNSALEVRIVAFDSMFKAVYLLSKYNKPWEARKVLHNGLAIFRVALTICMPLAIKTFWEFVYEYSTIAPGLVRYILAYCTSRKGCMADIDPALEAIFDTMDKMDYESMSQATSHGFSVCGAVFDSALPGLHWHSAYSRSIAIAADMLRDYQVRMELLHNLLAELESCGPNVSPQILCLKAIAYMQFMAGEFAPSNDTIGKALIVLESLQEWERTEYPGLRIQLLSLRVDNLWYMGSASEALQLVVDTVHYAIDNHEEYVDLIVKLHFIQQDYEHERVDLEYNIHFQDMVTQWVNLSVDEKHPLLESPASPMNKLVLEGSLGRNSKDTPTDTICRAPEQGVWHEEFSVEQITEKSKAEETIKIWRLKASESEQEALTLPIVEPDD